MSKFFLVYCYEQTKMDGISIQIVKEGIYDTFEEADEADSLIWDRFENASPEKRPSYLLTTEVIEIE